MSQYVKTFEERYPEASVRLEYLHPTGCVESVAGGGAELGLISYPRKWPELTVIPWREEVDGPGGAPVAPVRRPRGRWRSASSTARPFVAFDADLSIRRAIDRCLRHHEVARRGGAGVRQHREHQARRRDPGGRGDPARSRPWPGRSGPGSLVAVRIDGQDPKYRLTRPLAIIHRRHDNLDLTASRFLELLTGSESRRRPLAEPRPHRSRRVPVGGTDRRSDELADAVDSTKRPERIVARRPCQGVVRTASCSVRTRAGQSRSSSSVRDRPATARTVTQRL